MFLTSCHRVDEQGPAAQLHSLALVRSCVQKALGLLRDPSGVASRSRERIHTLLALLGNSQAHAHGSPTTLTVFALVIYLYQQISDNTNVLSV